MGFDEVEDAVGNDDVDGFIGDERGIIAELGCDDFAGEVVFDSGDGIGGELFVKGLEVELEVLDAAFDKLDVRVADVFGDDGGVAVGDFEHVIGHVDADHFAFGSHDLGGDEADFSGAGAEVENGFAGVEPFGRVSAAVVFFDDFGGDGFEKLRVVIDRATEVSFNSVGGLGVTFFDGIFCFHRM